MSVSREELKNRVSTMIEEQNYVGAYMAVKQSGLSELDRTEFTGRIAATIVEELGRCSRREERERAVYLRSLLAWIFRDFPGLSALYREQLRLVNARGDLATDMYQGLKNINEVASGRKGVTEGVEETVNQVRESLEEAADSFRAGDAGESFRSFVSAAETGLRDGLTQMGQFFEALNRDRTSGNADASGEEQDEVDRMRRREEEPSEDYEDVRFRESGERNTEEQKYTDGEEEDEND